MGKFLTELDVRLCKEETVGENELWELISPLVYQSNTVGIIVVPAGFKTDFASVPRVPIAFWLTGGLAKKAAVLHDYLYALPHVTIAGTCNEVTRSEADKVLLGAAIDGIRQHGDGFFTAIKNQWGFLKARMMWLAVRVCGSSHWER